jgi:hypothetical protein
MLERFHGESEPTKLLASVLDAIASTEKAAADQMLKIAPRCFNPEGVAWLPILHTMRRLRSIPSEAWPLHTITPQVGRYEQ